MDPSVEADVLAAQSQLASLPVEDMDDLEEVRVAVGNARDLLERLENREREIVSEL